LRRACTHEYVATKPAAYAYRSPITMARLAHWLCAPWDVSFVLDAAKVVLSCCSQSKRPPSALSQALQVVPPHSRSAPPPCRHRTMNRHHGWLRGARLVVWGPVGAHSPRPARPGLRVVPQVAASTTISLLSSRPARILARPRTCGTTGTPMCRAKCRRCVVGEVWIMAIDTK
jgi:hypothetical protein